MNRAIAPEADSLQTALSELQRHFPERTVAVDGGIVSYRELAAGPDAAPATGPVFVLLHGIGSGAASWLPCALELARSVPGARVIAWNAPGYGKSAMLATTRPGAQAYAARLHQLVRALGLGRFTLVGHSLGAMMAAAYSAAYPAALARLVLISPARGYGVQARLAQGAQVARERLSTLGELGIHGMATQRSARLLSAGATGTQRDWVRWNMAQLNPAGYTQAVYLLCGDAIENYAQPALIGMPGQVWCGSLDAVTTPDDCRGVAQQYGFPFQLIAGAGHACYVEQPHAAAAAILN
jgi:pimeloyl-ACP methyl ester carboxylesterase